MIVKLSDAFDLQMGKTPDRNDPACWGGAHKWVSIADLTKAGKYITDTKECITDRGIEKSGIKPVPKGTVIMSFKLSIGKTAITTEEIYTNEAIMAFIDKGTYEIDTNYIYHLFSGKDWLEGSNKAVLGLTLNKATLSQKTIELPPLAVQKKVVEVLDRMDSLISLRKKQLQKLDDLVKSRFVEMFGDPKINPYNYPVANLGEHIAFLTSGSRGWAKYCVDDGKEWFITIKNVKDCTISVENMQSINAPSGAEAERTRVQEGDLLISITADLGRTGVVTKEIAEHGAYINQHLTCIRLDKKILNPLYVAYFMETTAGKDQFEAKNQSAVKAGLNFNSINSLRIMIPPIDKQNEFVTFVKHVDKSRLTIQNGLYKIELLKQSLMQKYFGDLEG